MTRVGQSVAVSDPPGIVSGDLKELAKLAVHIHWCGYQNVLHSGRNVFGTVCLTVGIIVSPFWVSS